MNSATRDNDSVAAAWVVRMDRGELTAAESAELDAWLAADSLHMGAFVRAETMWVNANRVAALDRGRQSPLRLVRQRHWLVAASIAALALIVGIAGIGTAYDRFAGREHTEIGEIRRITLDDGSTLVLNTESLVQVKFAAHERRIVLRRGEATFNVAHDASRPFIVQGRNVSVKAVGTSFTVRLRQADVAVTVTEGVVEVLRPVETGSAPEMQRVSRNRELIAQDSQPLTPEPLSESEVSRRLAWQEGMLVFDGERLADAIAEVNRYSPRPIRIDSERLREQAFVGVFRVGDARAFANSAAAAFKARVEERHDELHLVD